MRVAARLVRPGLGGEARKDDKDSSYPPRRDAKAGKGIQRGAGEGLPGEDEDDGGEGGESGEDQVRGAYDQEAHDAATQDQDRTGRSEGSDGSGEGRAEGGDEDKGGGKSDEEVDPGAPENADLSSKFRVEAYGDDGKCAGDEGHEHGRRMAFPAFGHDCHAGDRERDARKLAQGKPILAFSQEARRVHRDRTKGLPKEGEGHRERGAKDGKGIIAGKYDTHAHEASRIGKDGKPSRPSFLLLDEEDQADRGKAYDMEGQGRKEASDKDGEAAVEGVHEGDDGAHEGREGCVHGRKASLGLHQVSGYHGQGDRTYVLSGMEFAGGAVMESLVAYVKRYALAELLSPDLLGLLVPMRRAAGEYLIRKGEKVEWLFFFVDGRAKVYSHMENGASLLVSFYRPFDILGDVELFSSERYILDVVAVTDIACLGLPVEAIRKSADRNGRLFMYLCGRLGHKLADYNAIASINLSYPVENRLASYLLATVEDGEGSMGGAGGTGSTGGAGGAGGAEQLGEIADILGASYRQLSRVLRRLRDEGILDETRGRIRVLDMERLRTLARDLYLERPAASVDASMARKV